MRRLLWPALCALAFVARAVAAADAPPPLAQLSAAELRGMEERLKALAADVERTLTAQNTSAPPGAPAAAPRAKLEYLYDALQMSLDAVSDLHDVEQRGPSVALRGRTLRRALWALAGGGALATADYLGALFLFAAVMGKVYAFQLAYDDTIRFIFGLGGATTTGLAAMPWHWRALAAPLLLAGLLPPALLLFLIFVLQRVLVMDRALLGFAAVALLLRQLQRTTDLREVLPPGAPALDELFWWAARSAAAALAAVLVLQLRALRVLLL